MDPMPADWRREFVSDRVDRKARTIWRSGVAEREGFGAGLGGAKHAAPNRKASRSATRASGSKRDWRRERDSNPRNPSGFNGFQDRRLKPLGHLSSLRELARLSLRLAS